MQDKERERMTWAMSTRLPKAHRFYPSAESSGLSPKFANRDDYRIKGCHDMGYANNNSRHLGCAHSWLCE